MSLQIDVIANDDQRALRIAEIDAAGGVGQDHGMNAHAPKHANGEGDFLRRVSLVEMDAALHGCNGYVARFADHHAACVSDRGGARE